MMGKLLFHIISGIAGLFLAYRFVPGVYFFGTWQTLFITGAILGFLNFLLKPILKAVTLPFRIITLGILTLVINMGMIWLIEIFFPQNWEIRGLIPLFLTTLIVWLLNFFFGLTKEKK